MARSSIIGFVALLYGACTPHPLEKPAHEADADVEMTIASSSATSSTPESVESEQPDPSASVGSSATTCGFVGCRDVGDEEASCDPWKLDCPEGEKCVTLREPDRWARTICIPLVDDPKRAGEACELLGERNSGVDTCDETSVCEFLDAEDRGFCATRCTGSPERPVCESGHNCFIDGDGTRLVCIASCDPIVGDCPHPERLSCLVENGGYGFSCDRGWGDQGLRLGEECVFDNSCLSGLLCWYDSAALVACEADACCTAYCDLDVVEACKDQPGTQCVPFFEEGYAPPAYVHVGACIVPE